MYGRDPGLGPPCDLGRPGSPTGTRAESRTPGESRSIGPRSVILRGEADFPAPYPSPRVDGADKNAAPVRSAGSEKLATFLENENSRPAPTWARRERRVAPRVGTSIGSTDGALPGAGASQVSSPIRVVHLRRWADPRGPRRLGCAIGDARPARSRAVPFRQLGRERRRSSWERASSDPRLDTDRMRAEDRQRSSATLRVPPGRKRTGWTSRTGVGGTFRVVRVPAWGR